MLNLTRQERQVIIFLVTLALVGIGINFLCKRYSAVGVLSDFNQNLGRLNINTADKEELISLPGIGKSLAERILQYRRQKDGFKDVEELKEIKGISNCTYERLKNLLFVE